jgi:hypothetical protein
VKEAIKKFEEARGLNAAETEKVGSSQYLKNHEQDQIIHACR